MPVAGVDVGSVAAKAVIFDPQSRSLLGKAVLPTGWNAREAGEKALAAACADAGGIAASRIVGTGYGRISLPFADKVVTEITCHARGAVHLFPGTGVVLDIGGQDSKVIAIAPDGSVTNFVMNDKCAAGTGRFLDVMARVLEVKVEDLGTLGAQSTKNVSISSTCTVFAESEVISQLSLDTDKRDIINGIHHSVASRVAGLAHRVGVRDQVVMTGGVAQNTGVVKALEEELGHIIYTSPLTQYNGALGAALFAYQRYQKEQKG